MTYDWKINERQKIRVEDDQSNDWIIQFDDDKEDSRYILIKLYPHAFSNHGLHIASHAFAAAGDVSQPVRIIGPSPHAWLLLYIGFMLSCSYDEARAKVAETIKTDPLENDHWNIIREYLWPEPKTN